jgi:ribosome recycling factor
VVNAGVNGDVSLVARVKDLKAKLAKAETAKNLAINDAEAAKKKAQDKFDAFKADIDAQLKAADAEITGAAT